jgi:diacylglycerol kinase
MPFDKAKRTWWAKFRESVNGACFAFRTEKTLRMQATLGLLACGLAGYLRCSPVEWACVLLAIGLVLTTEIVNTAIENLFHGLDEETRSRWNACLDVASGAVLTAGFFALAVGAVIFGSKLSYWP